MKIREKNNAYIPIKPYITYIRFMCYLKVLYFIQRNI